MVVLLFFFLSTGVLAQAKAPPGIQILALDFNNQDDVAAYREELKSCPEIQIRSLLDEGSPRASAYEKLKSLCETDYSPQFAIFAGHYAASWAGPRGSLTLNDLERLSCDPKCQNLFKGVGAGFFHSCNNLLSQPKRGETPEQYLTRLLTEHRGEFSEQAIVQAGLDMYRNAAGVTNADRLSQVFPNSRALLGFSGGAPLTRSEGGASDLGVRSTIRAFVKRTGSTNACEAFRRLAQDTTPQVLKALGQSWISAMNQVDVGKNAAVVCRECEFHPDAEKNKSRSDQNRDIVCALESDDPADVAKGLRKVLEVSGGDVQPYLDRIGHALRRHCGNQQNCEILNGLPEADRTNLVTAALTRFATAPTLLLKYSPFVILEFFKVDETRLQGLRQQLAAEMGKMLADPKVDVDILRSVISLAPPAVVAPHSKKLNEIFETSENVFLKDDARRALARSVGAVGSRLYFENSARNLDAAGSRLLGADRKGLLWIWDTRPSGRSFYIHVGQDIETASFSADGERFWVVKKDGRLEVRNAQNGELLQGFGGRTEKYSGLVADSATSVTLLRTNGELEVRDRQSGGLVSKSKTTPHFHSVASARSNRLLLLQTKGTELQLWDTSKTKVILSERLGSTPRTLEFSADGERFVLVREKGGTAVYDARDGRELKTLPPADYAALSPDGRQVLTLRGSQFELLNLDTGEARTIKAPNGTESMRFGSDTKTVYAKLQDKTQTRLNLAAGGGTP